MRAKVVVLAAFGAAVASVAPTVALPTKATLATRSDAVGPAQILQENDLSTKPQPAGAIALLSDVTAAEATRRCALLGEALLPFNASTTSSIVSQVNYLQLAKSLTTDRLWVAGASSSECTTYSITDKKTATATSCDAKLNALCTSSGQFTTDVSPAPDAKTYVTVAAPDLTVTGYRDARSYRFLGIPYADAPLGDLRFQRPRPYSGPRQRTAVSFGPACPQDLGAQLNNFSEDCLFLNVWTPYLPGGSSSKANLKPVAFYIYGGAFNGGQSSIPAYDGTNFASRQDVVVVSINYRLGALGFLATSSLEGNYGIRDQILGLEWVKRNIAAFGGDPSRVTIFGFSAGGQSVVSLLSSTKAKGLFHAAVSQSSPTDLPWLTKQVYLESILPNVATAAGCPPLFGEEALVRCLRKVPYQQLLTNSTAQSAAVLANAALVGATYFKTSPALPNIEKYLPLVDAADGVIDGQFDDLVASGKLPSKVPTMFSQNKDEAFYFVPDILPVSLGNTQLGTDLLQGAGYSIPQAIAMSLSGQFAVNRTDPDGTRNALSRALTQSEWLCPTEYLLDRYKSQVPVVYHHLFVQGKPLSTMSDDTKPAPEICLRADRVCHGSEVLPVFGTLNFATRFVQPYRSQHEVEFSQMVNDAWGAFFRTHDPTPSRAYLEARGAAYSHSLDVFYSQNFRLKPYASRQDTNILGFPDQLRQGLSPYEGQCSFFDKYGYVFQRV